MTEKKRSPYNINGSEKNGRSMLDGESDSHPYVRFNTVCAKNIWTN
jgi:hypothetical protein